MARDETLLRRFVFLLGAERVVPLDDPCHLTGLLQESERVGKDLTREFYGRHGGDRSY